MHKEKKKRENQSGIKGQIKSYDFVFSFSTVRFGDHQRHVPGEVRRVSEGSPEGRVQRGL